MKDINFIQFKIFFIHNNSVKYNVFRCLIIHTGDGSRAVVPLPAGLIPAPPLPINRHRPPSPPLVARHRRRTRDAPDGCRRRSGGGGAATPHRGATYRADTWFHDASGVFEHLLQSSKNPSMRVGCLWSHRHTAHVTHHSEGRPAALHHRWHPTHIATNPPHGNLAFSHKSEVMNRLLTSNYPTIGSPYRCG